MRIYGAVYIGNGHCHNSGLGVDGMYLSLVTVSRLYGGLSKYVKREDSYILNGRMLSPMWF